LQFLSAALLLNDKGIWPQKCTSGNFQEFPWKFTGMQPNFWSAEKNWLNKNPSFITGSTFPDIAVA